MNKAIKWVVNDAEFGFRTYRAMFEGHGKRYYYDMHISREELLLHRFVAQMVIDFRYRARFERDRIIYGLAASEEALQ